ncbi:MAG: hypothetical protein DI585_01100 [Pseudomonas fluorescens]|nr:MAG: hypothetical protein DI585_01100 [Pseudomonas fluorescens]
MVLLPGYRSGTRLKVNVKPRASVRGRLVDALGNPLALQAGEIHPQSPLKALADNELNLLEPATGPSSGTDETSEHHRIVFTDRNGQFNVHGLPHGAYNLILANNRHVIPFEVTGTATGVVDIGEHKVDMLAEREHRIVRRDAIKFVSGSGVVQ